MAGRSNYILWLVVAFVPVLILLAYQSGTHQHTSTRATTDRSTIAVVYAGIAAYAHLEKAQPIIAGLVKAGYSVTFITGEEYRDFALATGAHYEPLDGPYGMATEEEFANFLANPGDGESSLGSAIFMAHMQEHLNTIQRVFGQLQSNYDKIVYIHDVSFLALLPVQLGAPGILPTVSIGLGIGPIVLDSDDTFPFPATRLPDTTIEARRLHRLAYQNIDKPIRLAFDEALNVKLREMKAIEPYPNFYHSMGSMDAYLAQIGLPGFEYNRTDLKLQLRFLGIPERPGGSRDLPPWWQDVLDAKAAGQKIIVVSQGTASFDLRNLLVPTLQAMEDRNDIFVVGTTVTQGPELPDFKVPTNARLAQYVPFDILFQQASLLISTGGYGTVLQSIRAGVPMVLAGVLQDKAHVAALAEHVGIAVNLRTEKPSIDSLKAAVVKVLGDGASAGDASFGSNILNFQDASKMYDPVQRLDATIQDAVSTNEE